MLKWVLSLRLSAWCKFTLVYQCNDNEMGINCDVNSEDSGSFISAWNSLWISDPTECSNHFPPSLKSEPLKLPEAERFEDGISPESVSKHCKMATDEHQLFETALAATIKGTEDGAQSFPLQEGHFCCFTDLIQQGSNLSVSSAGTLYGTLDMSPCVFRVIFITHCQTLSKCMSGFPG